MKGFHRVAAGLCCVLALTARGQEEIDEALAGQGIAAIVGQNRVAAIAVIRAAAGAFGRDAFTARQNAEILLTQLDLAGAGLKGKRFNHLSDVQRTFVVGTRNALDDMRHSARYSARKARMLTAQADSLLATIPDASDAPRVLDFSPRYLVASRRDATVDVTIEGSSLAGGDPTLSVEGKPCERTAKEDDQLVFRCDVVAMADGTQLTYAVMRLATFRGRSWWDGALDVFREAPAPTRYEIGIAVVPRVMGRFAADARIDRGKVVPVAIGDVVWGVDQSIDLPDHVTYLTLRARLVDGVAYEDSSVDAPVRDWYTASIDLPHRKLVIRPRGLEVALSRP
jgi:hypothetical protein